MIHGILDLIVGVICVIIFVILLPKIWDSRNDLVTNLIHAGLATMILVGGALIFLMFLSEHWFISSVVIGVIVYVASGQNSEKALGAAILSAILLFVGSYFTDTHGKETEQQKNLEEQLYREAEKIRKDQERERQRQKEKDREKEEAESEQPELNQNQNQNQQNSNQQNNNQPQNNNSQQNNPQPLGRNWIKDNANDIYIQNPEPAEGESISWSGGYVQDGRYKFADGFGTTVWRNKFGEVVQVDEGTFKHGKRQGKIKHQFFPSGNIAYSNWNDGKEIK